MKSVKKMYEDMLTEPTKPSLAHTTKKMDMASKMFRRGDDKPVKQYAKGGAVWQTPNPAKKSTPLTPAKKAAAKTMAKKAGRPYPNLVDNLRAVRKK